MKKTKAFLQKRNIVVVRNLFLGAWLLFSAILLASCEEKSKEPNDDYYAIEDNSNYITSVFNYHYAPGQYAGNILHTNTNNFVGKPSFLGISTGVMKSAVSLGGWGGYIIGGFDHNIENKSGNDLIVFCGSSPAAEPGIVYVMPDDNNNNLPDETWYELKGSEWENSTKNYQLTYHKPTSPNSNITWSDNLGHSGELTAGYGEGSFSSFSWWNSENEKTSITFEGTKLPDAYENTGNANSQNWKVLPNRFSWGYAENANASDYNPTLKGNEFDISHAVDTNGNSISLSSIRFIKIQTGVFQQAGWLNEVSTEVNGAGDLHRLK